MQSVHIVRKSDVKRTPRVVQLEGMFDLGKREEAAEEWYLKAEHENIEDWSIGAILGPSGSGKSTIMEELFGSPKTFKWNITNSLVDDFKKDLPMKSIIDSLSGVGFGSPPSWLKPFAVLSTGQKFRCELARAMTEDEDSVIIIDEFTSVVDRTVAQIASAAFAKAIRRSGKRAVIVSCHNDIIEWLQPDWTYEMPNCIFARRCLQRRPDIELEIVRSEVSRWKKYREHHYLSGDLNITAQCLEAYWKGQPVAFTAALHFPHPKTKNIIRGHRMVCLPDFQGVGIGNALSVFEGSYFRALGKRYRSTASHPAVIFTRMKSPLWRRDKKPDFGTAQSGRNSTRRVSAEEVNIESLIQRIENSKTDSKIEEKEERKVTKNRRKAKPWMPRIDRLAATFEYVGPACSQEDMQKLRYGGRTRKFF